VYTYKEDKVYADWRSKYNQNFLAEESQDKTSSKVHSAAGEDLDKFCEGSRSVHKLFLFVKI